MSDEHKASRDPESASHAADVSPPGPLEYPTGPRGIRPSTAWIIGLFALTGLASIARHLVS